MRSAPESISHVFHNFHEFLQTTLFTDHSATIIDNVFSNVIDYDTSSGNITTLISDHFAQFLMIKTQQYPCQSNQNC